MRRAHVLGLIVENENQMIFRVEADFVGRARNVMRSVVARRKIGADRLHDGEYAGSAGLIDATCTVLFRRPPRVAARMVTTPLGPLSFVVVVPPPAGARPANCDTPPVTRPTKTLCSASMISMAALVRSAV